MNFKEFLNEGNRELVSVYHVSPRSDMVKLRPVSYKKGVRSYIGKGKPGIFVAPRFKDAVAWATSYVSGKKHDTQQTTERLKEKGGGRHSLKFKGYRDLTVYQIKMPKEVLNRSVFTDWWEREYFITAEDMQFMNIVKSKTYSIDELLKMQSNFDNIRTNVIPTTITQIKELAKTNLAAQYYLELKKLYSDSLLSGAKPVIASSDDRPIFSRDSDHIIDLEINKLMKYIFERSGNLRMIPINALDKNQEKEVIEIYKKIKSMIET